MSEKVSGKRQVLHQHVAKTAGTAVNNLIKNLYHDDRYLVFSEPGVDFDPEKSFTKFDYIESHTPLRGYLPAAFVFAFLREPKSRLLAQISDWRREATLSLDTHHPESHEMLLDAKNLFLDDFLEKHEFQNKFMLDNHITRSFAAGTLTEADRQASMDTNDLVGQAVAALHRYDFIGVTEQFSTSLNMLQRQLQLPYVPPNSVRANSSAEFRVSDADIERSELLHWLVRNDEIVYQAGLRHFKKTVAEFEPWNSDSFERYQVLDSLAELTAKKTKKQHKYSVREPLVGSGFHLRDSPGNENCRVWSGPEKTSTLYLPTPQGKQISLLFWLGGFAPEVEIDAMKIDGVEESFWTEAAGNQILLVVPCVPKSDFVKVEFCLNKVSLQTGDSRLLGFNLASYGWRDRK